MKVLLFFIASFMYSSIALATGVVSFHADGFPVMDIESEEIPVIGKNKLKDGLLSGKYRVDMRKFTTDIERRDEHMQKMLETKKYPFAKFNLEPISIKTVGKFKFIGTMLLHGVSKKVYGQAEIIDPKTAEFLFNINTDDFKLKRAKYELIKVGKIVNVTVKITF